MMTLLVLASCEQTCPDHTLIPRDSLEESDPGPFPTPSLCVGPQSVGDLELFSQSNLNENCIR